MTQWTTESFWAGSLEQTVSSLKRVGLPNITGARTVAHLPQQTLNMVKRCVLGCYPHKTLFPFPKTPWLRARWLEFLHFEEGGISESSRLCARHFAPECFTNLKQYEMGFSDFLYLIDMPIPTIYTVGASTSVKVSRFSLAKVDWILDNIVVYLTREEPPPWTGSDRVTDM